MIEHRAKASFIYFVSLGILAALNAALGGRVSAPFQFIAYQLLIAAAAGGVIWMLVGRSRGRRHGEGDRRRIATYIAEAVLRRKTKRRE